MILVSFIYLAFVVLNISFFCFTFGLTCICCEMLSSFIKHVLVYQVFGTDKLYWFIPAYSEEDLRKMPALQGLEFPSKPDFDSQDF